MKIVGTWSGHDCSFCILENGMPVIHAEYERYNREKSPSGDALNFLFERCPDLNDVDHFISCFPQRLTTKYSESYQKITDMVQRNGGTTHFISHHQSHASHAFYSSKFHDALIVTMDGGGIENNEDGETACTIWRGKGNKLEHIKTFEPHELNIGGVWTRITRYVFKLQNGWPLGSQEGTVMAMAAMGNPDKYLNDFWKMLTVDKIIASHKPPGQPVGAYIPGKDPKHPYLDKWAQIADESEQDRFDLAAGLQKATEELIKRLLSFTLHYAQLDGIPSRNLCVVGGVALNSVAMGKIKDWFPEQIDGVYIPPVPYDGGLCLGAAQYLWHHVLDNDRIEWSDNFSPYLGERWNKEHFDTVVNSFGGKIEIENACDDDVIDLLSNQCIVSVFNEGSESGRRALGNRSILADPRNHKMKDTINEKVKHRQWFRPFAPSILREEVDKWFVRDEDSPYMQFVIGFNDEKKDEVPAVVHFDGTARLQTVTENDNSWYYGFLCKWYQKSGVPIILNTSFNDREPICENAFHAINCFLNTEIDYLYFPEYSTLIKRAT